LASCSASYWTTNFAEVQRALSASNISAARRTPLIGAFPKIFLPAIIILPGLIAVLTVKGLGGSSVNLSYDTAIPHLIANYPPEGMLGIAVTGLLAAFMAGVAANVTAFNTVVTYDLIQAYFVKDRDAAYYLRAGRLVTIGGILISVLTAFIAKGYSNIMNYIQTLFSIFNAPLFATFIIAMFWKRATAWGGFFSLVAGTAAAYIVNRLNAYSTIFHFGSPLSAQAARIANRFDIRRLIGGLFMLYGAILFVLGLVGSHQIKTKADGINVDLYTGIGMLIFGALPPPEPRAAEPPRRSAPYLRVAVTVIATPARAREIGQFSPAV
jgi:Na+/proline symporter